MKKKKTNPQLRTLLPGNVATPRAFKNLPLAWFGSTTNLLALPQGFTHSVWPVDSAGLSHQADRSVVSATLPYMVCSASRVREGWFL